MALDDKMASRTATMSHINVQYLHTALNTKNNSHSNSSSNINEISNYSSNSNLKNNTFVHDETTNAKISIATK